MFDFSFAELALIIIVAVIFIGPNELPVVIKSVAKAMKSLRALTREIHQAFEELGQESGLKDTAAQLHRDIHYIKGDDGKLYERYPVPTPMLPKAPAVSADLPPESPHE